jgi:hypothetical protein
MFKKILTAFAILATIAGAHAQSAGFGLSGTIVPGACTIAFSSGGVHALGSMSTTYVKSLSSGATTSGPAYIFPDSSINMTVTCSAATKIALSFVDNRAATKMLTDPSTDPFSYGIASSTPGQALGRYALDSSAVTINGGTSPAARMIVANGSTAFAAATGSHLTRFYPGYTYGYGTSSSSTTPDAITSIEGALILRVNLSKTIVDAATQAITIDGSGTATLVYL